MGSESTYYPPTGFYFEVRFLFLNSAWDNNPSSTVKASFHEVSGLGFELPLVESQSSGVLSHHLLSPPKWGNLTMKRGLPVHSRVRDRIIKGVTQLRFAPMNACIALMGGDSKALMSWDVYQLRPTNYQISPFNSMSKEGVVFESLTFVHRGFELKRTS